MKKYLQSGWMRVLSGIVCAISIVSLVVGVLGFVFVTEYRDTEGVYKTGYKEIAENYALYAVDMMEKGKEEELKTFLNEKGMNCWIKLISNKAGENEEIISTVEKELVVGKVSENDKVELEVVAHAQLQYCENSLLGVLVGYPYYYDGTEWIEYPVQKIVFSPSQGLFCYETEIGLYKVSDIMVKSWDEGYYDYSLREEEGTISYYNGYYNITLDPQQYQNWEWVEIDGQRMTLGAKGEFGQIIEVLPNGGLEMQELQTNGHHIWHDTISVPNTAPKDMYEVQISWTYGEGTNSLFTEWADLSNLVNMYDTFAVPMIIISFVFLVSSFGLMVYSTNGNKENFGFTYKIPVVCYSAAMMTAIFAIAAGAWQFGIWQVSEDIGRLSDLVTLAFLIAFILAWIALGWFQNIVTRIKSRSFWRTSEVYYIYLLWKKSWHFISKPVKWSWGIVTAPFCAIANGCKKALHLMGQNIPLFWGGIAIFVLLSVIEFFLSITAWWNGETLLYCLVKIGEAVALIWALYQIQQLHEGSKRIATGDLSTPVNTQKMFWKFKEHGENINKVSEGIALAVNERMKSEHFKTELITNVSHDIKTPLTSIINYVDLIKKEELQDEKLQSYVDVLDRQSARLKKLIEDLMEASKASTGNLTVNLEECDIEVLMTQVIGEFEERLQKNQLEVVVNKPDHPVKMMADGRHMWRVLDNLLNNACKYSLPGSRVYISLQEEQTSLQQKQRDAVIVFKNISKTALNIPSEELMERFVRGDSSRNTEGSGLGLSIAQSLTELMHGSMKLEIDGDLFKVTLRFPTIG